MGNQSPLVVPENLTPEERWEEIMKLLAIASVRLAVKQAKAAGSSDPTHISPKEKTP